MGVGWDEINEKNGVSSSCCIPTWDILVITWVVAAYGDNTSGSGHAEDKHIDYCKLYVRMGCGSGCLWSQSKGRCCPKVSLKFFVGGQ
jgi:hypothetical protein